MRILCFSVILALLGSIGSMGASLEEEQKEFNQKIALELADNPRARMLFDEANQARERNEHQLARDRYAEVRRLAPGFVHAVRRQAMEELVLGNRAGALALGREALAMDASAENLGALSTILATGADGQSAPDADRQEALDLAERARGLAPDDFHVHAAVATAALANEDIPRLSQAATRMVELMPHEPSGYYFQAIAEASQGELGKAERSLKQAREHGLPEEDYQPLLAAIHDARPWYARFGIPAAWGLAVWAGCLLVLLLSGWVLSRTTLRAAQKVPTQASGEAAGLDLRLRRIYQGVLWLSCIYYWISVPIVALLVVVAGGGVIYAFIALGRIPIKLVILVVVVVGVSLVSIVKSLFARSRDEDPGLRLQPSEEPRLQGLLREVAGKIGTRPVDNVYLTPGTDLAVMERGGMMKQLRNTSERCLILGVGVLDGMKIGPFKAILAHEYGHFSNKDTAGGGFALSVRRSLFTMAQHLAEGGAAAWYNPAWLFVNGFHRVFLRISQGASRLQEVLADRWAAFAYGAKAFERGLLHVIERGIRFSVHADATLGEVVEGRRALANLYTYHPASVPAEDEIAAEVKKAIHREPSPYDSHPSPVKRFLWTRALNVQGQTSAQDEEEVWTLFRDRESLERRLTDLVRANLQVQGIEIPGGAQPAMEAQASSG